MPDVRMNPFKPMTDGTYSVDVSLRVVFKGSSVVISDHADLPVGDACAALHQAALQSIGDLEVTEARYTDAFERKPPDPGKVVRGEAAVNTSKS